ncbi:MAG: hypothetical protein AAGF75_04225, partial [Cyanobacteria bacterium P01_H01_bin.130]
CYLGLQLLVSFYLGRRLKWASQQNWGRSLLALILTSQIISCTASAIAPTWWVEQGSYDHPNVAAVLNDNDAPLILSQAYIPRLVSLSYQLRPDAQIAIRPDGNLEDLVRLSGDRPLYLYRPSPQWLDQIRQQYPSAEIESVYQSPAQFTYLAPLNQHSAIQIYRLTLL